MRWERRTATSRPARPKMGRLEKDEREKLLQSLTKAVERSPVLRAFQVDAQPLRGRFYLRWNWMPQDQEPKIETWGRITPLDAPNGDLLLEVEFREGRWSEIARGGVAKVINAVAGDEAGTFHGLGSLDKSLRKTGGEEERIRVKKSGKRRFVYTETGESLSVQEALFHDFGMPVQTIAQPAGWYSRHRTPEIAKYSKDRTRVLVRFMASSFSGESFGGTCLYLKDESGWSAYTIRPNQSEDIATAESWLVKRKWRPW